MMTKLLEEAIAKVREFPAEDQDTFAVALLSMAGEDTPMVHLDDETRAAVREGLAQAQRGEFVRTRKSRLSGNAMVYESTLHAGGYGGDRRIDMGVGSVIP